MKKKLTLTVLLILVLTAIASTGVYAGFQAVPSISSNLSTKGANEWIIGIRQMEEAGQGMGLTETVDTTTGLSAESNGIDVHMTKNTEYGAAVLLGASDYGKQGVGIDRYMTEGVDNPTTNAEAQASTTGNVSGIYHIKYLSWVAAGGDQFLTNYIPNIAPRYINIYTTDSSSAKVGDATVETDGWHRTSDNAQNFWIAQSNEGFLRGNASGTGAFFSLHASLSGNFMPTSACIVVGSGF